MAVQHDATDHRPRRPDPLRLPGQTAPSSLRRKKGKGEKGRRALSQTHSSQNLVISASGGRATSREEAESYSLFAAAAAAALPLLRPSRDPLYK